MTKPYDRKAAELWRKSRLRDRIDAIIAHEISEADHGSHEAELKEAQNRNIRKPPLYSVSCYLTLNRVEEQKSPET
jgi:hypothetical protein